MIRRDATAEAAEAREVESGFEVTVSEDITNMPVLAIVGCPNVGKSVMFNNLTGRYVTVSNYPGTTVEVSRGRARIEGVTFGVVDTPGMYSLNSITDEERVARRLLLEHRPDVVLHMVDAKNLERMLPVTLQLGELGIPVILVLNMMDEAERLGIRIDVEGLSEELGVPVLPAVATTRRGLPEIRAAIRSALHGRVGREAEPDQRGPATPGREAARESSMEEAMRRQAAAREILRRRAVFPGQTRRTLASRLSDLTTHPVTGLPILAAIIYFGLYRFVGVFGAGDVVNFLEKTIFAERISPWFNSLLQGLLPGSTGWRYWTRELFGGEYGLVTLGVTYAMAIVLPIVSLFFLFFSVLEDTGYFPRLALLVDRVFKKIGLNGRAVIPLVLGFGCDTMATMVTRIQETKRERIITTLLLALAIPCSAQNGVITALLAKQPAGVLGVSYAWLAWAGILLLIFTITGRLASRLIPGKPATFYMELPPLRLPRLGNVVAKTLARMKWYFMEVLPLFMLASALIWIGRITHVFDALVEGLRPVVSLIGLPPETATAFLYGFFRRDFGAAGLYGMADAGRLTGAQLLIACVTLTLLLPCVAQFLIMKKERGLRMALVMSASVMVIAFLTGGAVHLVLSVMGLSL